MNPAPSVVIVDDSMTNLIVLKRVSAAVAPDGVQGFSSAVEAASFLATTRTGAVVVDYDMPGITGVQFVAEVRSGQMNGRTPIIMVTSNHDPVVRSHAIAAGASMFLTKPVDPIELKNTLRHWLSATPAVA